MQYLLDTHIFLWYILGDTKLSESHKEIIENIQHNIYVSNFSIWEILIKSKLGKLPIPNPIFSFVTQQIKDHDFLICPNHTSALQYLEVLPDLHKDPFDRMLISQSLDLGIPLITEDSNILRYKNQVEHLNIF